MAKYKIGYTTGVFDMFHIGHLNILKRAKEQCDFLIVGVSTDENVFAYKGHLPVVPYKDRAAIVASIKYVDKVVPQESMSKPFDFVVHADHLVRFVPQLGSVLTSLAQSGAALSKAIDGVKSSTRMYLKNRRKEINTYIDALGIPYIFDAQYKDGRIDTYHLIHKDEFHA